MTENREILMIKLKAGDLVVGFVNDETEDELVMSFLMEIRILELAGSHGLSMYPMIPFDDGLDVHLNKAEILFTYEPTKAARDIYKDKLAESLALNATFMAQYYADSIIKNSKTVH